MMKSRSENDTLQQPQALAAEPVLLEFMKYTYIIWPCLCWIQDLASPFDLGSSTLCEEIYLPTLFFSIPLVLVFKTRGWMELIFSSQQFCLLCYFHLFLWQGVLPPYTCVYLRNTSPLFCRIPHWGHLHLFMFSFCIPCSRCFSPSLCFYLPNLGSSFSTPSPLSGVLRGLEEESHMNADLFSQGLKNVTHLAYIVLCIPSALACVCSLCVWSS